jgi:hypothetical protein
MAPISFVTRVFDLLRPVVPRALRRPLRDLWRPFENGLRFWRGKRILRCYSAHYRNARRVFRNAGHRPAPLVNSPPDIGVRIGAPGASDSIIDLPAQRLELVQRVSRCVEERFRATENCVFVPRLPAGPIPALTRDVRAIQDAAILSVRLANPFDVDGLADLCGSIVDQAEQRIYASHVLVDKVYVYRSPICRDAPRASWIWHYDNHPREVLKVMIYLTDVTAASAPFEYLRSSRSREPIRGRPLAPLYGHGRVPVSTIEHHLRCGGESHMVTGPAGTIVVFDGNVVHRANLATEHHRDVLVLQLRPATFQPAPRIDRGWTGSFQHLDFNANPEDLRPQDRGGG